MAETDETMNQSMGVADTEDLGIFFSPEGVIMMTMALVVDISQLATELIPLINLVVPFLMDLFAIFFIGGWMYMRSRTLQVTQKTALRIGKAAKWAKRLRWLRPLFIFLEFIPIANSLPLWAILVFMELKYS